jgi:hypothetical protein
VSRPAGASPDLPALLARVEGVLRAMIEAHRTMLAGIEAQREAVRHARAGELASLSEAQRGTAARIAALEKRRAQVMQEVTRHMRPTATAPITARELAALAGGAAGATVLELSGQLKMLIEETQRSSSILRAAADMLGRHMAGIMQTVQSALSRARLYSRAGQLTPGAPWPTSVDLKS